MGCEEETSVSCISATEDIFQNDPFCTFCHDVLLPQSQTFSLPGCHHLMHKDCGLEFCKQVYKRYFYIESDGYRSVRCEECSGGYVSDDSLEAYFLGMVRNQENVDDWVPFLRELNELAKENGFPETRYCSSRIFEKFVYEVNKRYKSW